MDSNDWPRQTEQDLAEQIRAGSRAAEREFASCFYPRLRAFFRARTKGADWSEELTQETLLAAICALRAGRLRDEEALPAFVLGIARNKLGDHCRQQTRDARTAPLDEVVDLVSEVAPPGPELMLLARNEMAQMPDPDRQILWLTYVEGANSREVADATGLTEEAVRQRKSRLLRRLAEKLSRSPVTNRLDSATNKVGHRS